MGGRVTRAAAGILLILAGHLRVFGADEPCTVMIGWVVLILALRPSGATNSTELMLLTLALVCGLGQLWLEGFFVSDGWRWVFFWLNSAFIIGLCGWPLATRQRKGEQR